MQKPQVLKGHVSEETAHLVQDYPAGFKKRCQIRYWIETNEHGQRVITQTTNPETGAWNKPKKSTYTTLRVLYIDPANNYVRDAGISEHATKKQVEDFLNTYGVENFEDEYSSKTLELMKKYRALMIQRFAGQTELAPNE